MKAITLWQPWASLWAAGIKQNETRSWATSHRGPLAIHAAKLAKPPGLIWTQLYELDILCRTHLGTLLSDLPRGCIVGAVNIVACFHVPLPPMEGTDGLTIWGTPVGPKTLEHRLGDYTPGRYAWIGQNHRTVDPIPCHGQQGLWTVSSVEAAVLTGEGVVDHA